MNAAALLHLLQKSGLRVFTSSDLGTLARTAGAATSKSLERLAGQGLVVRIKRGVWASRIVPDLNPYEAVPYLRAPWPAYVSLYSALADQGLVEEIPQVVYGVSTALPKRYRTAIGEFHIHHLPERLMWGFEMRRMGAATFPMADREKAFLDTVYLALIPRSPIGFPKKRTRQWRLDAGKLRAYAVRFRFDPLTRWLKTNQLL